MNAKELSEKLLEITESLDDETIKSATDDQLMGYLFLVEKMKKKIEKAVKLEGEK